MGVMGDQLGLRERRRRQTSADIRDAAAHLALERGFDKVTIEEICTEAGISTRTFFNYFPNKESAIAYGPSDIPPELVADFVAAGPAPYSVVLAELITLAAHHLRDVPPARKQAAHMLELAKSSPAVLAAFLADLGAVPKSADRHHRPSPGNATRRRDGRLDLGARVDSRAFRYREVGERRADRPRRHADALRRARRHPREQHLYEVI